MTFPFEETDEPAIVTALAPLADALRFVAAVLIAGRRKYPDDSGFRKSAALHVERARVHLERWRYGDTSESHLEHAAARLLMALTVAGSAGESSIGDPDGKRS